MTFPLRSVISIRDYDFLFPAGKVFLSQVALGRSLCRSTHRKYPITSRVPAETLHLILVQISVNSVSPDQRLCRLTCGKALPFRRTGVLSSFYHAGWKAEPSSLHGGGRRLSRCPERPSLSASQAAEPRRMLEPVSELDSRHLNPALPSITLAYVLLAVKRHTARNVTSPALPIA